VSERAETVAMSSERRISAFAIAVEYPLGVGGR
jgi:hypothetical protein